MKTCVVYLEERFKKMPDESYSSIVFGNDFWNRYLTVFDQIHVVARAEKYSLNQKNSAMLWENKTTDPRVTFHEVPYYHGAFQFVCRFFMILFFIIKISKFNAVHILRMPGVISVMALTFLIFKRKKYGVELVGDPYDVFGAGGVGGRFSKIFQFIFTKLTKIGCHFATSIAYVTSSMQHRYPGSSTSLTTHYSSICLKNSMIVSEKDNLNFCERKFFLILMVGSMEQKYKGFDVAINAMSILTKKYSNIILNIVGDGVFRKNLEDLTVSLNIEKNVLFLGVQSRESVLKKMDDVDFFIMPSRTEGLPRALIEAMARGLPAIGSNVGGIPELLSKNYIFESENVEQLAALLETVIPDQNLRTEMSKENIAKSWDYEETELQSRREMFYKSLLIDFKSKEVL